MSGSDWVAIAGILGTLGGVIVGAVTMYKIQVKQLKHADETRFHDQRLDTYMRFSRNVIRAMSYWRVSIHNSEVVNKTLESLQLINMVGTKSVLMHTNEVNSILVEILELENKKENIPPQSINQLQEAFGQFCKAARLELKVD